MSGRRRGHLRFVIPRAPYEQALKRKAQRRPTLRDVAKVAGVSLGMASRVLGEYGSFSDETRQKVQAAAKKIGYRPNTLARSLRLGRTKAIGVVVANIASYHWTTFVRGIEKAAAERGYQVILGTTSDDPEAEKRYVRALFERHVDGIVLSPSSENEEYLAELARGGFPMVLVESNSALIGAPTINIDDRAAAKVATEHLLKLGHNRIGLVAGLQDLASGKNRLMGYQDALASAGLAVDEELIRFGGYTAEGGYGATHELLTLPQRPSALVICNESMTGGAVKCLKDLQVTVPSEISLVAFDDPAWASFCTPALTTVRTPRMEVAKLAFETLISVIKGSASAGDAPPSDLMVETEFVVRESTQRV